MGGEDGEDGEGKDREDRCWDNLDKYRLIHKNVVRKATLWVKPLIRKLLSINMFVSEELLFGSLTSQ